MNDSYGSTQPTGNYSNQSSNGVPQTRAQKINNVIVLAVLMIISTPVLMNKYAWEVGPAIAAAFFPCLFIAALWREILKLILGLALAGLVIYLLDFFLNK